MNAFFFLNRLLRIETDGQAPRRKHSLQMDESFDGRELPNTVVLEQLRPEGWKIKVFAYQVYVFWSKALKRHMKRDHLLKKYIKFQFIK